MAVYKNITSSGSAVTLIAKNGNDTGAIQKILISNNSANTATVRVYLGVDTSNTLDFYFSFVQIILSPYFLILKFSCINNIFYLL